MLHVRTVLLGVMLAAPAFAAQPRSPALAGLDAELKGRAFTTRIPLGSALVFYHNAARRDLMRRIDTEVSPNGQIEYLAIKGNLETNGTLTLIGLLDSSFRVPLEKMTKALPPGTRVQVTDVGWKDDRLELLLAAAPDGAYAKLKLMFGKGFQGSATRQTVLSLVSRALVLEDYERLQRVEAEYPGLKLRLEAARSAYAASATNERLKTAEELGFRLKEMEQNRAAKEALARDGGGAESAQYAREAADLESTLSELRGQARLKRSEEIGALLKDKDRQIDALLSQLLARKPSGLADWRQQREGLEQARRLLGEKGELHQELSGLAREPSTEEAARFKQQQQRVETLSATIEKQRGAVERLQADEDYRAMDRKLVAQRDAYTRAFGTQKQGEEAGRLLDLLQQMYNNRLQVAKSGSPEAAGQAATLLKEIERTKRQQR